MAHIGGDGSAVGNFERIERMDRARLIQACDLKPATAFHPEAIDFLVATAELDSAEFQDILSELKSRKVPMTDLRKAITKRAKAPTILASGNPGNAWMALLDTNSQGQPLANQRNVAIGLENDPAWAGVIAFDELACEAVLRGQAPYETAPRARDRMWNTHDTLSTVMWFQERGIQASKDLVYDAMLWVADRHRYDPLREYLLGLQWDGVPRLNTFANQFLGAPANTYSETVVPAFFVEAVARGLGEARPGFVDEENGVKADTILVLEGTRQGEKKSSMVRALFAVRGTWFTENLPDMHRGDDAMLQLLGSWGVEIGEGEFIGSARDARAVKNFLSRQVDKFRLRYDKNPGFHRRRCVFVMTTNETDWNKDETGARRFWPVRVTKFDAAAIAEVRDQIWAEAVQRFQAGEKWWFDDEESVALIAAETDKRYDGDLWENAVSKYVDSCVGKGHEFVLIDEILEQAVCMELHRAGKAEKNRIGRILRRMRWISDTRRVPGHDKPVSVYVPDPAFAAPQAIAA